MECHGVSLLLAVSMRNDVLLAAPWVSRSNVISFAIYWCHSLTPRPTCIDDPLQITVVGILVQPPGGDVENMQKSGSVKEGMLKFAEGGRILQQPRLRRQGWVR